MQNYQFKHNHTPIKTPQIFVLSLILLFFFSSCSPDIQIASVDIKIIIDGNTINSQAEIGTSVQTVLSQNNISLNQLDKVTPGILSIIIEPVDIIVTRVEENFESEEIIIPYERQTVRNESLPEKQTVLIQNGVNGLREITYREILEDGIVTSRTEVRTIDTVIPRPEIIMVGVQAPFSPENFFGKIAYLTSGNAWLMEVDTANRKPLITSGDLDGRIFSISEDGKWLLFTRSAQSIEWINELWVLNLEQDTLIPVNLKTYNIIHFAEWEPGFSLSILLSTVEKRDVAPGWQANNNLIQLTLGADGNVLKRDEIIETNSGGIYGWWGTNFSFSRDGSFLAYSRPDSIGLVDLENKTFNSFKQIIPYQTRSEWAWVSPISWSPDNTFLYWVNHQVDQSYSNPETSPFFDLQAINVNSKEIINAPKNVGMFAYPSISPDDVNGKYRVAFLQAIFPENSETSRYRVMLMDRDGSNSELAFPTQDSPGIEPQTLVWENCKDYYECRTGLIYQGNIWFINVSNRAVSQITGDGLITLLDWK